MRGATVDNINKTLSLSTAPMAALAVGTAGAPIFALIAASATQLCSTASAVLATWAALWIAFT